MARAVVAAESTTRRVGPKLPADRAREQRKMRAAEHDGVDARIEMREISLGDGIDRFAFAPALFGQRHEHLAGNLRDMRVGTQREDRALVGAALHRAFGGEHRDAPADRRFAGRLRTGLDHADHRQRRKSFAQAGQRGRGCRIAGHDQRLDAAAHQRLGGAHRITRHGFRTLGAVGQTRGVAEVQKVFVRKLAQSARAAP